MARTINMARRYNKRPSEIINVDNDYLAYCFDELAMIFEDEAMDEGGNLNWNKIKWKSESNNVVNNNDEMIKFIQTGK